MHSFFGKLCASLETLVALGALDMLNEPTGGSPSTRWAAIAPDQYEENALSLAEDEEPAEDQ